MAKEWRDLEVSVHPYDREPRVASFHNFPTPRAL